MGKANIDVFLNRKHSYKGKVFEGEWRINLGFTSVCAKDIYDRHKGVEKCGGKPGRGGKKKKKV